MPISPRLADAAVLVRATWAVASSPPMPDYRAYMRWYRSHHAGVRERNPPAAVIRDRLLALCAAATATRVRATLAPPLFACAPARRTFAALISFVDDYDGPFPHELFPHAVADALRAELRRRAAEGGGALTLDVQFAAALALTGGHPFAAAVALHALTRSIARGRDRRAIPSESPWWNVRCADAAWIAPFADSVARGGDAAGDTYHYWANFVIGMQSILERGPVTAAAALAFLGGAPAMALVRGGLMGSPLFAGSHARVDRLGLAHGRAVGTLEKTLERSRK